MKKELIISVIVIVAFLFISLNITVLAANPGFSGLHLGNDVNTNPQTPIENGAIQHVNTGNKVTNNNVAGDYPNTGLENPAWLLIGICGVTAVFAFSKIKEYKAY